ncbi:MAG: T9SS type A sorting domain-containing protein [Bacteroidetes bacterium]|nr:T9SS type A sorting domain-containing protein [Bacteroidota bacterium]
MGYLSPGMYILEISGEGFRHSQKIIKQ